MIKWSDRYSMADANLDDQHRLFIAKINEFEAAGKAGKTARSWRNC